jgi:hypothetical protein
MHMPACVRLSLKHKIDSPLNLSMMAVVGDECTGIVV